MTKQALIEKVAEQTDVSVREAAKVISSALVAIQEELKTGNPVIIYGFGNFSVRERHERNGAHPLTGEKIKIAASKFPSFRASKIFKAMLNGD